VLLTVGCSNDESNAKKVVDGYLQAIKMGEDTSEFKGSGVADFVNILDYKYLRVVSNDEKTHKPEPIIPDSSRIIINQDVFLEEIGKPKPDNISQAIWDDTQHKFRIISLDWKKNKERGAFFALTAHNNLTSLINLSDLTDLESNLIDKLINMNIIVYAFNGFYEPSSIINSKDEIKEYNDFNKMIKNIGIPISEEEYNELYQEVLNIFGPIDVDYEQYLAKKEEQIKSEESKKIIEKNFDSLTPSFTYVDTKDIKYPEEIQYTEIELLYDLENTNQLGEKLFNKYVFKVSNESDKYLIVDTYKYK